MAHVGDVVGELLLRPGVDFGIAAPLLVRNGLDEKGRMGKELLVGPIPVAVDEADQRGAADARHLEGERQVDPAVGVEPEPLEGGRRREERLHQREQVVEEQQVLPVFRVQGRQRVQRERNFFQLSELPSEFVLRRRVVQEKRSSGVEYRVCVEV